MPAFECSRHLRHIPHVHNPSSFCIVLGHMGHLCAAMGLQGAVKDKSRLSPSCDGGHFALEGARESQR